MSELKLKSVKSFFWVVFAEVPPEWPTVGLSRAAPPIPEDIVARLMEINRLREEILLLEQRKRDRCLGESRFSIIGLAICIYLCMCLKEKIIHFYTRRTKEELIRFGLRILALTVSPVAISLDFTIHRTSKWQRFGLAFLDRAFYATFEQLTREIFM